MNLELVSIYRMVLGYGNLLAITQSQNGEFIVSTFYGKNNNLIKNVFNKCGPMIGEQVLKDLKTGEFILGAK